MHSGRRCACLVHRPILIPTGRRSGLRMFIMRTKEQRMIGMLGGMSWESSAQYYRLVNELVRERLGGLHSARCLLASVDFADIETLQVAGRWEEAGQLLAEAAKGLEAGGADVLLLCTNTMHKVADQVQAAVNIPLLHLGDVTAHAVTSPRCSNGMLTAACTWSATLCIVFVHSSSTSARRPRGPWLPRQAAAQLLPIARPPAGSRCPRSPLRPAGIGRSANRPTAHARARWPTGSTGRWTPPSVSTTR